MSKGLEALEKIKKLYKSYIDKIGLSANDIMGFDFSIMEIEKELKEYERLKEMYNHALEVNSKLSESVINYKKELKALEIIKNKQVDIRSLDNIICLCATDENAMKEYNRCCGKDEEGNDISLTKEEFELLKEVLL